jgi:5-hydroxyisourate hydrolase-like protein (transthyretin family)
VADDVERRNPANVTLEFYEVASSGDVRLLSRTLTNADGRTDRPLTAEQPILIAQ